MLSVTRGCALLSICSIVLAFSGLTTETKSVAATTSCIETSNTTPMSTVTITSTRSKIIKTKTKTKTKTKHKTSSTPTPTLTSSIIYSSSSACVTDVYTTLDFDSLPTGAPPPPGYGYLGWDGDFEVVNASDVGIIAKSGSNVLAVSGFTGHLYPHGAGANYFDIESFAMACTYDFYGIGPEKCSLNFFTHSIIGYDVLPIGMEGPFDYVPDDNAMADMETFNVGATASEWYTVLTSGLSRSTLYLDDIVIIAPNPNCSYSPF